MRRWTSYLAVLTVAMLGLGLTAPALAQDGPQFVEVGQLDLAPSDADAFLAAVKTVRDAAVEVSLDPAFAWDTYRWDNTIYFVSWHESLVDFEDPEAFARAFQGTAVESRVMQAFQSTGTLDVNSGLNEVSRARPDLGFIPASPAVQPGEHGGVFVLRQWPMGDPAAFEESLKGFMGMLTEMGGVYPVIVSQNVIGKGGFVLAVPFDNLSNFYGDNSLEGRLMESGMAEHWGEHEVAHRELLSRAESFIVRYLPEHSYRPEGM